MIYKQLFHPMASMSLSLICDHNSYSMVKKRVWFTVFHYIILICFNFLKSNWIRGTRHFLLSECTQIMKMLQIVSQVFICLSQARSTSVNVNTLYSTYNVIFDLL